MSVCVCMCVVNFVKLAGVDERFCDVLVMQGRADPWCPWFPGRVAADLNKLSGWFGGGTHYC